MSWTKADQGRLFHELWIDCADCAEAKPLNYTDGAPKAAIKEKLADLGYVKGKDGKYRCHHCRSS